MNVFETHAQIVADYASYIRSFINSADPEINRTVDAAQSTQVAGAPAAAF